MEVFHNSKYYKDGKNYRCISCDRKSRKKYLENADPEKLELLYRNKFLKYKYGIDHSEYLRILESQGGVCAICGNKETSSISKWFAVDHCHDSGAVRGLLCNQCNRGLGMLGDTSNSLYKAFKYLKDFEDRV